MSIQPVRSNVVLLTTFQRMDKNDLKHFSKYCILWSTDNFFLSEQYLQDGWMNILWSPLYSVLPGDLSVPQVFINPGIKRFNRVEDISVWITDGSLLVMCLHLDSLWDISIPEGWAEGHNDGSTTGPPYHCWENKEELMCDGWRDAEREVLWPCVYERFIRTVGERSVNPSPRLLGYDLSFTVIHTSLKEKKKLLLALTYLTLNPAKSPWNKIPFSYIIPFDSSFHVSLRLACTYLQLSPFLPSILF